MITMQLTSDNHASYKGHAVKSRTPVLTLCRLLKEMAYPDEDVIVMRGTLPCISGRLHKMAGLAIHEEPGIHFATYKKFDKEVFA